MQNKGADMLGGKIVDNFMDKLAEKISAQDIIRANAQAEALEAERTKQEAEQYKQQLEELRQNEKEHRLTIEDTKASLEEAKASIAETMDSIEETKDSIAETKDSLSALSKRIDENETKVHDVGVQVYRNVQAVVEKGQEKNSDAFKELNRRGEAIQVAIETKNNSVVPLLIVTLLVAGADLVINILRILGIL